jgi:predicted porin
VNAFFFRNLTTQAAVLGVVCLWSLAGDQLSCKAEGQPAPPQDDSGSAAAVSATPWRATVELYGLAPLKLDTRTTINGFTTTADLDLGEVLSRLKWASSLRASVERGRVGLLTDLYYSRLAQEGARTTPGERLTGNAKLGASQGIYDLAVRYRFGESEAAVGQPGQFSLIPYAGVRVIDAQLDTKAEIRSNGQPIFQREGSFGRTWAQPLLGTQATVFLSPRLRAFARADIGGFGLSGHRDLSGNAQLGLGYAVGNNTDLNISWRYMGIEYDNSKSPQSGFKSSQNGIEVGLKFFF